MAIVIAGFDPVSGRKGQQFGGISGPGKTNAVLPESEFLGLKPVPYNAAYNQVQFANSATTLGYAPQILVCDATTAGFVVTLPTTGSGYGKTVVVIKMDSSVNTITFAAQTGNSLWNYSTWTGLTKQYETVTWLSIVDSAGNQGWIALLDKAVV